jgi:hypothetical protein
MEFQIGFWDYVTFAAFFIIGVAFLAAVVFILGLPGRIAIARPEADAVYWMGWIGFIAVVPWIQALIWAFKPTDVVDLRYLPKEVQRETAAMIARLSEAERGIMVSYETVRRCEDLDRNNPMTAHQISLRMSAIGASIARFAAIRQLDRVYGSDT